MRRYDMIPDIVPFEYCIKQKHGFQVRETKKKKIGKYNSFKLVCIVRQLNLLDNNDRDSMR